MSTGSIIEVVVAALLLIGGIILYRLRSPDGYGSQGAVLLIIIAILMLIHGFGLLEYRPSPAELGQ